MPHLMGRSDGAGVSASTQGAIDEGVQLHALEGAQHLLQQHRRVLCICCRARCVLKREICCFCLRRAGEIASGSMHARGESSADRSV